MRTLSVILLLTMSGCVDNRDTPQGVILLRREAVNLGRGGGDILWTEFEKDSHRYVRIGADGWMHHPDCPCNAKWEKDYKEWMETYRQWKLETGREIVPYPALPPKPLEIDPKAA